MIDVNREGEVWVFAEQHNGHLEDTPVELMSKARHLADTLGVKLAAAVLGDGVKDLAAKLIHYGADKVYVAEHPMLVDYQTNSYAKVMYDLIHKHEPQIVLYGATIAGRDLAPRIASATKAGLTADCTDLQIGDHETVSQFEALTGAKLNLTQVPFDQLYQEVLLGLKKAKYDVIFYGYSSR